MSIANVLRYHGHDVTGCVRSDGTLLFLDEGTDLDALRADLRIPPGFPLWYVQPPLALEPVRAAVWGEAVIVLTPTASSVDMAKRFAERHTGKPYVYGAPEGSPFPGSPDYFDEAPGWEPFGTLDAGPEFVADHTEVYEWGEGLARFRPHRHTVTFHVREEDPFFGHYLRLRAALSGFPSWYEPPLPALTIGHTALIDAMIDEAANNPRHYRTLEWLCVIRNAAEPGRTRLLREMLELSVEFAVTYLGELLSLTTREDVREVNARIDRALSWRPQAEHRPRTITEFVQARIDEDVRAAQRCYEFPVRLSPTWRAVTARDRFETAVLDVLDEFDTGVARDVGRAAEHIARHGPGRAERQADLYRGVLARHRPMQPGVIGTVCDICREEFWPCDDLLALAEVWADHPDYCKGWTARTGEKS